MSREGRGFNPRQVHFFVYSVNKKMQTYYHSIYFHRNPPAVLCLGFPAHTFDI